MTYTNIFNTYFADYQQVNHKLNELLMTYKLEAGKNHLFLRKRLDYL